MPDDIVDINDIIRNAKPEIKAAAVEQFKNQVLKSLQWSLESAVENAAKDYVETEVLPEVKLKLAENKTVLVESIIDSVQDVGEAIGQAMIDKATKTMNDSWAAKKVFSALFD